MLLTKNFMQQFSQKYTLIQLLEDLPEGFEYDWKSWPLHVTVADVFAIDWTIDTLSSKLTEFLSEQPAFAATADHDEFFGPNKDIRVVLINKTPELLALHEGTVQVLEEGNVIFNTPQYNKEGFLPHSTAQKHRQLQQGDIVPFNAVSIVDLFPNNDPYRRKILKTIPLKSTITP